MTQTCPVCMNKVPSNLGSCPSCGYKLLGSTQAFDPIQLDADSREQGIGASPHALLKIVRGPQIGLTYTLTEESYDLGRSPHCAVFLNDMTVSRLHAFVVKDGNRYLIRDNHSYNGVWVNNVSVESKSLAHGDIIQIGTFCLRYEESR